MSYCLPAPEVQHLIADALHHAVSRVMDPSVNHIAPINTIGCFLLQHFFHREYRPVAGSVRIHAGGQSFGREARVEDLENHEYYLWVQAVGEDGRVELVDFGARYWRDWAKSEGVLWLKDAPEPVMWQWLDEVSPDTAVYEPHSDLTHGIQEGVGRAIAHRQKGDVVDTWENAINDAIDYLMEDEAGLRFLVETGIAEPIEEDEANPSA